MMGGNWSCGWGGAGMSGFGWTGSLFFWAIVIVGTIWIVRWIMRESHMRDMPMRSDQSMNILKERYAKGEISKEEFELRKKDLMAK